MALTEDTAQRRFAAHVNFDDELQSNIITLVCEDPQLPERTMEVAVAPELGSNLFRFRLGEHELIYCDREILKKKGFTANFVLWPIPNRLRDCRYHYQGKDYSLEQFKQNERPYGNNPLIHGFAFDRAFSYEQPQIGKNEVSVTTTLQITPQSPYYDAYPFASRLSLTYSLNQTGLTITYEVFNDGDQDLPYGFALHPYFSTLGGKSQTTVSIPVEAVMEADEELLPTGRVLDTTTLMYRMFDLRQPRSVDTLWLDHVYTKLRSQEPTIIGYKEHNFQLHLTASSDFTHVVIYTLDENPYFCVEHQTCSTDALNLHQHPALREIAHLLEVKPGQSKSGSLYYRPHFL